MPETGLKHRQEGRTDAPLSGAACSPGLRGNADAGGMNAPLHRSQISADDMEGAAAALEELADALADEPSLFAQHATRLQSLDIAAQLLRKLALRED